MDSGCNQKRGTRSHRNVVAAAFAAVVVRY
jgi:hypothetical protein